MDFTALYTYSNVEKRQFTLRLILSPCKIIEPHTNATRGYGHQHQLNVLNHPYFWPLWESELLIQCTIIVPHLGL